LDKKRWQPTFVGVIQQGPRGRGFKGSSEMPKDLINLIPAFGWSQAEIPLSGAAGIRMWPAKPPADRPFTH